MRIITIVLGVMLFTSVNSLATESAETSKKEFDQYCYLDDDAFSEGSRVEQQGKVLQCRRNSEGLLSWQEPEK